MVSFGEGDFMRSVLNNPNLPQLTGVYKHIVEMAYKYKFYEEFIHTTLISFQLGMSSKDEEGGILAPDVKAYRWGFYYCVEE